LRGFVSEAALEGVTLVAQDWGGPIGLSVLAVEPERFARVVVANTVLHTLDDTWRDLTEWAAYETDGGRVVLQSALIDYITMCQRAPTLAASLFVRFATATTVAPEVLAAYDAPFPDESYKAALRQFPLLIPLTPNDPGAVIGRRTWEVLEGWHRPFLTAFSDGDPATRGWDRVFQARVPGARGRPHVTIGGAGHYVQEDRGAQLARVIADFVDDTAPTDPSGEIV
jgi:haloalkane dehalogenase